MKSFKTVIAAVIAATVLLICHAVCFADGGVAAAISANDAKVGETVYVTVSFGETKGIASGSFNVVFDSDKLELTDASADTEMMSGVLYALNDKYAENAVRISFAASGDFGAKGGDLMKLVFTAKEAGSAEISVEKLKLGSESEKYTTSDTTKTIIIAASENAVTTSAQQSTETTNTTAATTAIAVESTVPSDGTRASLTEASVSATGENETSAETETTSAETSVAAPTAEPFDTQNAETSAESENEEQTTVTEYAATAATEAEALPSASNDDVTAPKNEKGLGTAAVIGIIAAALAAAAIVAFILAKKKSVIK